MNVRSKIEKPRSRRGRPRGEDKRRPILDAALRVFAERGFHGASVPLIAGEARVAVGTLYRCFASKEHLVNEVFRDAKTRLRDALFSELPMEEPFRVVFDEVWRRLIDFARRDPWAFRFLELQDHTPYLDEESRAVELAVLGPIYLAGSRFSREGHARSMPVEAMIALVWGALVGLLKAERLGYIRLDSEVLAEAGEACWTAIVHPRLDAQSAERPRARPRRKE